jgi:high-affinity nickel-transport protein
MPQLQAVGGVIGTAVSALFLFAIAGINLAVLIEVYRSFRGVRRGEPYHEVAVDEALAQRGVMGRLLRPFTRGIRGSWQMYPLGVLFGLGFDTASEVGLLGIAALEAGKGLPVVTILIFPLLFTVGMCLLDTTDGILMLGCYGWAFVKPVRKLYYNLNITLVSVLVAVGIGSIEALGILDDRFGWKGRFWDAIDSIGDNFGTLGFAIIGIFVLSWIVSTAVYKVRGYDEIEATIV